MKPAQRILLVFVICLFVSIIISNLGIAENTSTLNLPAALETIGEEAFYRTTAADRVIVPEGTTEILDRAFAYSSISEIVLPDTVRYISESAFSGCSNLEIFANEGSYAYTWAKQHGCLATTFVSGDFRYSIVHGMCVLEKYNGNSQTVIIPQEIKGMPVIRLAEEAFSNNTSITSVTIPSSVMRVDDLVFWNCSNLRSLSLPNSLSHIGIGAFYNCSSLEEIVIPSGITRIEYDTFYGCSSLREISIPNSVIFIDEGAFYGCEQLCDVVIPSNVSFIGKGAFYHCSNIKSMTIPNKVTSISDQLLNGCTNLEQISIPDTLVSIGTGAFYNCSSLQQIVLPDTLTTINSAAFYNCSKLSSLTIPNSVTTIGGGAFYGCASIPELVIPNSVVNIEGSLLYQCRNLMTVELPSTLLRVYDYMFTGCSSLVSIQIPTTVMEIGFGAFNGCHSLTSMVIPHSVYSIGDYAFYYNNNLSSIQIEEGVTSIGSYAFGKCVSLTYVYIPESITSISNTAFYMSDEVIIYGISGSYAESFALDNEIPFIATQPELDQDQELDSIIEELDSSIESYFNDYGVIEKNNVDNAFEVLKNQVTLLFNEGKITSYEIGSYSIGFRDKYTDVNYAYMLPIADAASADSGAPIRVLCCTPQETESWVIEALTFMLPSAKQSTAQLAVFPNYSGENYEDSEVTLGTVRSISSNQVIIWDGHGGWIGNHIWILTHELANDRTTNALYQGENAVLRACHVPNPKHGEKAVWYAAFSAEYVEQYCGSMDNTFLYFTSCHSAQTNELANAFIRKGASVFIGATDTVWVYWGLPMLETVIKTMTGINPETENYYTVNEAITIAKRKHGSTDGNYGATIVGYGDSSFRFQEVSGAVHGKVCSAADRETPIKNANIAFYKDERLIKTISTDSKGCFSEDVPIGDYRVVTKSDGYIDFSGYFTVRSNEENYFETYLMVKNGTGQGTIDGTIVNAFTGIGVNNVLLEIREGWNNTDKGNVCARTTTNSNGSYTIQLPLGNYTIIASKDGFITNSFNVIANAGTTLNQNGSIEPNHIVGNSAVIRLEWSDNPSDLDSHLEGKYQSGGSYHVSYSNRTVNYQGTQICNLDVDDTDGYGPEHISLNMDSSEPYYYYVHVYTDYGSFVNSNAKVSLYLDGELARIFNVPTNQESSRYWNVFAILNGEIIVHNTITDVPDLNYANAQK